MTELDMAIGAESEDFTGDLSDEALDRAEGDRVVGCVSSMQCYNG